MVSEMKIMMIQKKENIESIKEGEKDNNENVQEDNNGNNQVNEKMKIIVGVLILILKKKMKMAEVRDIK